MRIAFASLACVMLSAHLAAIPACEKKATSTPAAKTLGPGAVQATPGGGHGGSVIPLGSASIGPFEAVATRDQGDIVAGKDAPIDVTVKPTGDAKVAAVRFWIGTQDAKGSVKARAEVEDPADPNRWHTHAEIPNPIPADARLWVEIEDDKGGRHTGSFELKP